MSMKRALAHAVLGGVLGRTYAVHGSRRRRALALTFDDGPDPAHTPRLLALLGAHRARATFFVTGLQAERHADVAARIAREGHELGNHSYRHVGFGALPVHEQLAEIDRTDAVLRRLDGREWHWFRPPQGALPPALLIALARRRHRVAMWSYDSLDYRRGGSAAIEKRFGEAPVSNGDVVLFHDDNTDTLAAVETLLARWSREGYAFETLTSLREARP